MNLAERSGYPLGDLVDVVFLDKPGGGERPIGLLCALCRVWARCRRKYARAWERHHSRDYFWASEDKSSEDAAHYQGVQVDLAKAKGKYCAGLLTDLLKAYEYVQHDKLPTFAQGTGFPLAILRMCLAAYSGPRRVVVDGVCSAPFAVGT